MLLIAAPKLATLSQGGQLALSTKTQAQLLFITGQANNEPMARAGPFIMNTRAENAQTWQEIQNGEFPQP